MATPCCAKCGNKNITWETRTFAGKSGILVYCSSCGAIVSWTPKPK